MCKHYECQYYTPETETCDYYIITGKRRGCPPTDSCDKLCTSPADMEILRKRFYTPREVNHEGIRRMEQVYLPNMKTKTLSELAQVSQKEALDWTRKVHPESIIFVGGRSRIKG